MTSGITLATPPNTNDVVSILLSSMASLSGTLTDYNAGSQIRTLAEAIASVIEQQGVSTQALALQTIAFSAMSIFGIVPAAAIPAIGTVTFSVNSPATQSVAVPQGTVVSTAGGIQFITTQAATLQTGSSSIDVPVQASLGGSSGNVPTAAITQLITGLTYPVSVSNAAPTAGGADAQSVSSALSQLSAKIASFNLASPVSIANGAVGVAASGSTESVLFSTVYEPWTVQVSGALQAGFNLYIDNGTGTASSGLITAVTNTINGNFQSNQSGYRPAGVPYTVLAGVPIYANLSVSGTLSSLANAAVVSGAIATAVSGYFASLPFGQPAYSAQVAAQTATAALGQLTALSVFLAYASAPQTQVALVSGQPFNRVILQNINISVH